MTSSQVFVGLAVTLALAVARHVVAGRARAPAIILLLPVGLAVAGRISAMSPQIAVMLGAILIVSGPTVVGPILESAATGPGLLRLAGPLAAEVILATVLTVAGLCDAVAPDTGLVAAIVMGMTVAGVSG